jgi:predicted phosphate transport protein (TIGR00153 family)
VVHAGNDLRRSIQQYLYTKTLIPESREDVLELLEDMDSLLDRFKGALWRMEIENLHIKPDFHEDFKRLIKVVVESVETIVQAARAFFRNISAVTDYLDKVYYWESESDKISTRLQMAIFRHEDLRLSRRMLQRELARHLDKQQTTRNVTGDYAHCSGSCIIRFESISSGQKYVYRQKVGT